MHGPTPLDRDAPADALIEGVLVLPDRVARGVVRVEDGRIASVDADDAPADAPLSGALVTPGAVDLHTDHVEKHLFPRQGVPWDPLAALLAHDAQMLGAGTTTVFDGLSVGAAMQRPERRETLGPLVDALEEAADAALLRVEHLIHLRCEICDPETPGLLAATIDGPLVRLVSVMDHTPGDRQSPDVARWTERMAADMQLDRAEAEARTAALLARSARVSAPTRAAVVAMAHDRGLPLMSHDDAGAAHVGQAVAEGVAIAEFPTTLEAARAARAAGLVIVAGAPNLLRGGSQSGNVAVRDLLAEGLVDVLASDYVPRSPFDAAIAIAADPDLGVPLHAAVAMATAAPARAAGLADRGALSVGRRADIALIRPLGGPRPRRVHLRALWRAGARVL